MCPSYKNNPSPKQDLKRLLYQNKISVRKNVAPPPPVPVKETIKAPREIVDPIPTQLPTINPNRIQRLNIVLTCVNYSDLLAVSLSENIKIIDPRFITVVTDSSDVLTQRLCGIFGVNCIITDKFYDDGAAFNKGKAINEGIKSIENPDWILLTDADIVFPPNFMSVLNEKTVNINKLYATSRYLCRNYDTYLKYKAGQITLSEMDGVHRCPPVGYFQLFSYNHPSIINKEKIYPETSIDASWSDMLFADRFTQKECIQTIKLIHLGDDSQNWKGRKTKRFITDEVFSNIISEFKSYPFKISMRKQKQKDKLAVITSFFNPSNYENIKSNYLQFQKFMDDSGVDLFTAELAFDDQEFFTEESEYNLHIRGGKNNIMWQKERLLNLILDRVPEDYNNIAWIDCDVIFDNLNWANEVNKKLNEYKLLQLFETVNYYNNQRVIQTSLDGIIKHLYDEKQCADVDFSWNHGGTSGHAWAIRRECIDKTGFIDNQILGGGDSIMMLAGVGCLDTNFLYQNMNSKWLSQTLLWSNRFYKEIKNSVFYITNQAYHLYHGKTSKRNYDYRARYLLDNDYNPRSDIKLNDDGLWEWNTNKTDLHKKVMNYFGERDEDDNLQNINYFFDGIFCINLDRHPQKWEQVSKRFIKNNIPVERIRAFDGKWDIVKNEWKLVKEKILAKYGKQVEESSRYGLIENEFAYGTLCTHIHIIKLAKQRKLKRILIFEDDVIFHKDFIHQFKQINRFKDWKLLYLGASQYDWTNIEFKHGYYHPKKTMGGFAYAIDSSVFDEILTLATMHEKSFDNCLGNFSGTDIQAKYRNNCYVLYPNLVIADVSDSDLREKRDMTQHSSLIKWDLSLYDFD